MRARIAQVHFTACAGRAESWPAQRHRDPRRAKRRPNTRTRSASLRPDAHRSVLVLPRIGRRHGRRPGRRALERDRGDVLRRRARLKLRHLRRAAPRAGVRSQRLRRSRRGAVEWDVKRLITSAIVGGRHAGYKPKTIRAFVERAATAYQDALREILGFNVLDRYYLRFEPALYRDQARKSLQPVIDRSVRRARERTSARVFERIMTVGPGGGLRLRENPPVLQHVDTEVEAHLVESFREYLTTVPADIAVLLSHFRVTDIALRVVGVGSVGTRCYLAVLTGPDGTPLILQIKQANESVLEEYGGVEQPRVMRDAIEALGQGVRVVDGQLVLQAMSDVFLGTAREDGRHYYVRQFHDMKGTVETEGMSPAAFGEYVLACSVLLARAHAQSANAAMLHGYVGGGAAVRNAIVEWSYAYADKSLDDFHQLRAAAKAGEIDVADDPAR